MSNRQTFHGWKNPEIRKHQPEIDYTDWVNDQNVVCKFNLLQKGRLGWVRDFSRAFLIHRIVQEKWAVDSVCTEESGRINNNDNKTDLKKETNNCSPLTLSYHAATCYLQVMRCGESLNHKSLGRLCGTTISHKK